MLKPALSLITLGVADFKASLAFYKDGLGWQMDAYRSSNNHSVGGAGAFSRTVMC